MQLKFGNIPVVIASSPSMAKQFFRVHDANFASRPALSAVKYTSNNHSELLWAPLLWVPHGPEWRQSRKIYLTEVFSAKRLEFFEPIRAQERRSFHSRLSSLAGKPVVIKEHVSRYTLSTMSRIVLGNEYFTRMIEQENFAFKFEELQQMLNEWMLLNGFINVEDWIPWLRFLDVQGYGKRIRELYKKFDRFHNSVIDDHLARRRAGGKDEIAPRDVVDTLLQLVEDQPASLQVKLTRDGVKGFVQVLVNDLVYTKSL